MEVLTDSCERCRVGKGRYKCPGCGVRSCSVQCVRNHKSETGCQGKRSKTNFVSLSEFTTSQLLSDYYFLEEAGRIVDSAHRGLHTIGRDAKERRQRLQRVRTAARKRGISLNLLPQGMARHTANTSRTVWNRDRREWGIEWRVRLLFPETDQEFSEERVSEDLLLTDVLRKYIHPLESDPVIRHRLRIYVGEEVVPLLKLERGEQTSPSYCQLQLQTSLGNCLRDRTVVEFPELLVVLSSAADQFLHPVASQSQRSEVTPSSLARLAANYGSSDDELVES